ncbi:MAG: ATP-binding cassette domain-containing protein, partial [Chloroflexota bacterium]|nr:ATP-binding cassette domain-containing protein [Chloroflexota bacterium]
LFRLYDPGAGAIYVRPQTEGEPVALTDLNVEALRHGIGLVTQDVQLFQASVRDNLTFFNPAIEDSAITDVLTELGLGDWLRALPAGLDTLLGADGGGLSAGQAQLLAFARIFLSDPGLVILDEASSRLDPATEALIERAMSKLLQNRTAILIAHRLTTVQRADDILILDQGQIVEHGSRSQLIGNPHSLFQGLLRVGIEEVLA